MAENVHDMMTAANAAFDQYVATVKPVMRSMATYQQAALDAGLSPTIAEALTLRLAPWLLPVPEGPED
jgi:hypothetical protein